MNNFDKTELSGFFPIKRILLAVLWFFLFIYAITALILIFEGTYVVSFVFAVFTLILIFNSKKMWSYILQNSHCFPGFNKYFSKKESRQLLKNEVFTDMVLPPGLENVKYIKESKNFFLIHNRFISKKTLMSAAIGRTKYRSDIYNTFSAEYFDGNKISYRLPYLMSEDTRKFLNQKFHDNFRIYEGSYRPKGGMTSDIFNSFFKESREMDLKSFLIKCIYGVIDPRAYYHREISRRAGMPKKEIYKQIEVRG